MDKLAWKRELSRLSTVNQMVAMRGKKNKLIFFVIVCLKITMANEDTSSNTTLDDAINRLISSSAKVEIGDNVTNSGKSSDEQADSDGLFGPNLFVKSLNIGGNTSPIKVKPSGLKILLSNLSSPENNSSGDLPLFKAGSNKKDEESSDEEDTDEDDTDEDDTYEEDTDEDDTEEEEETDRSTPLFAATEESEESEQIAICGDPGTHRQLGVCGIERVCMIARGMGKCVPRVGPWSRWSKCKRPNKSIARCFQRRVRKCPNCRRRQGKRCNNGLSYWSDWTPCGAGCKKNRTKSFRCTNEKEHEAVPCLESDMTIGSWENICIGGYYQQYRKVDPKDCDYHVLISRPQGGRCGPGPRGFL